MEHVHRRVSMHHLHKNGVHRHLKLHAYIKYTKARKFSATNTKGNVIIF